jgi:hypothetical protein
MISISVSMISAKPKSSAKLMILSILALITWWSAPSQGEPDLGALMNVVGPHLRHRGVEMVANLADDRP